MKLFCIKRIGSIGTIALLLHGCNQGSGGNPSGERPSPSTSTVSATGIGPITKVELEPFDASLAKQGEAVFEQKCMACHKIDERYVGPPIRGLTQRRTPEWIMNMILNPAEMLEKDPTAKELLATYLTPMTYQDVSKEQARAILEYFRQVDGSAASHVPK